MPLVTWNESLSVGVPQMDAQHQRLVQLLNQLHEAMSQGEGQQAIGPVLSGLLQYARTHFAAEERLMQKAGYGAFEAHKKQHDAFVDKVSELETRLRAGGKHLSIDALNFMKNWLVNHIQGQDKQYGPVVMAGAAR